MLVGDLDGRGARVGLAAGEHLVEHDAHRVDVRAGVAHAVRHELGREVGDGAEDGAGGGRGDLRDGARQAEVGDLDATVGRQQHVLRLDVAVHQVRAVGRGQRVEDRLGRGQRLGDAQRAALAQVPAQVGALDVLHREVAGLAVDALVEDAHEARVGELGRGACLAAEAGDELGPAGALREVRVHHLDRDLAVQPPVAREVDGGHAAAGDPGQHLVTPVDEVTDERVDEGGRHGGSLRSRAPLTRQEKRDMRVWTLATYRRVSAYMPCFRTPARPW